MSLRQNSALRPRLLPLLLLAVGQAIGLRCAAAQTLQDTLVTAYNTSPALLAERAALRATDENVPLALANWRPTVQFSASAGPEHEQVTSDCSRLFQGSSPCGSIVPPRTAAGGAPAQAAAITGQSRLDANLSSQTYGLTISQPIYRGGRTVAQTEQALNLVRAERAHLISVEQSVLLTAITDHIAVTRDQKLLKFALENETVLHQQLDGARDRAKAGEINQTDVDQAEAAYAAAIAARQQAEGSLANSRALYERDIGEAPGLLAEPDGVPELPGTRDDAVRLAATGHPDVLSAQFTQQAAEDTVRVVRGQLLPTVSLNAGVSRQNESLIVGQTVDDISVVAQLTVPLYDGGTAYAQSRQAQETVVQRRNQVDQARLTASGLAAQAWEQLTSDQALIGSERMQVKANESALSGVEQEAKLGERSVLDVLIAAQSLFQSRISLVRSEYDLLATRFVLASSLGRVTAVQLNLPVSVYDPNEHFSAVKDKWIGFGDDTWQHPADRPMTPARP